MDIKKELNTAQEFSNLGMIATQLVEGFISGIHKSPFQGFSSEFAEHKIYNQGESTRHIDWKLFAKTDKLYTKRYDDETNLRCHIIIDNSSSMHYPSVSKVTLKQLNKIAFSVLASASLMQILKKQRDAVGLSVYSDQYDFYAPEKSSDRHHQMLLNQLSSILNNNSKSKETKTYKYLHEISEKIHRRSMILFFTDMFQTSKSESELFEALQHLRYNKHEVTLFHVFDKDKELDFNFDNRPKRFIDVETNEHINLYPEMVRDNYNQAVENYFKRLFLKCRQHKIKYVKADINQGFDNILNTYLIERKKYLR